MNIKEGDIIVCINNGDEGDTISLPMLTLNKRYVVISIDSNGFIIIKNDVGINYGYYNFRFTTLSEIRKIKLERLNSIV